jgi:hypothetical protein
VPSRAVGIASPCSRAVAGALRARGQNTACAASEFSFDSQYFAARPQDVAILFTLLGDGSSPMRSGRLCAWASGTSNHVREAL